MWLLLMAGVNAPLLSRAMPYGPCCCMCGILDRFSVGAVLFGSALLCERGGVCAARHWHAVSSSHRVQRCISQKFCVFLSSARPVTNALSIAVCSILPV